MGDLRNQPQTHQKAPGVEDSDAIQNDDCNEVPLSDTIFYVTDVFGRDEQAPSIYDLWFKKMVQDNELEGELLDTEHDQNNTTAPFDPSLLESEDDQNNNSVEDKRAISLLSAMLQNLKVSSDNVSEQGPKNGKLPIQKI